MGANRIFQNRRLKVFVNGCLVYWVNSLFAISSILPPFIRTPVLALFFDHVGKNVLLDYGIYVKFPSLLSIGDDTSINRGCEFYSDYQSKSTISIGCNCRIAPNVRFHAAGHSIENTSYPHTGASIRVDNNVWIGAAAVILQGVTVGEGSVIAAGSVVNKDIPPNSLAGGVPAKIIRKCR